MLSIVHYRRFMACPYVTLLQVRNACTKLFVGGLSYDTNETVLRDAFIQHGEIIEVKVICDHVSGKSKGYGFVKFASEDDAALALKQMDSQEKYSRSSGTQAMTGYYRRVYPNTGVGQEKYSRPHR